MSDRARRAAAAIRHSIVGDWYADCRFDQIIADAYAPLESEVLSLRSRVERAEATLRKVAGTIVPPADTPREQEIQRALYAAKQPAIDYLEPSEPTEGPSIYDLFPGGIHQQ